MLKKIAYIILSFTLLVSTTGLTIAKHYCGDELATSKISFSGKITTCGMEGENKQKASSGTHFENQCCNNKVSVFIVDYNYSPSVNEFNSFAQTILQAFVAASTTTIHSQTPVNLNSTDVSPPGNILLPAVSLPKICTFLI